MELQEPARYCQFCGREVPAKVEAKSVKAEPADDAFWYAAPSSSSAAPTPAGSGPVKAEPSQVAPAGVATSTPSIKPEPAAAAPVKTEPDPPRRAKADAAPAPKTPKPAFVNKAPSPPVAARRRHPIVLVAASVVGVAIGLGGFWFSVHKDPAEQVQPAATVAAKDPATTDTDVVDHATEKKHAAETTPSSQKPEAPAPAKAPAPSRPKPVTPRAATAAAVTTPTGTPSAAPEPLAATALPAPVAASPAREVAETAPAPPIGPFFETKDVSESPRITARVEPKVPQALKTRSTNEIVIVRALVSQGGRPSRVSLLRKSKTGPELDAIVVEAVNQWTFTPAKKKGEAVSCWFNFGVQVSGAE